MEEESREMHTDDDNALSEKNKKKTVKTRAQVQALEKLYSEHKYPTESLKLQLAESIGLTEKQVSGWFCHRRLKDKRLMNGENHATGRQDRSSGVIQDRGSGHRQDSCGSTKQGEDRNFDTREVESVRLTPKELSAADRTREHGGPYVGNYNRVGDSTSSGSSSSLRNVSNNLNGDPFDVSTSRYLVPKFAADVKGVVKPRPGPSGYLKVKGHQVENPAITAVKRQLGKHYREDGPPLGVEFGPLPPGAFESSMQDPIDETPYPGEAVPPAPPDVPKFRQNPKFGKGCEYNPNKASYNSTIDGDTSFGTRNEYSIPLDPIRPRYRPNTSVPNGGAYHPRSRSPLELPEASDRDIPGSGSRDDNRMRGRASFEAIRTGPVSSHRHIQPYGARMREYNDVSTKVPHGENIENDYYSSLPTKGNEYPRSRDKGLSRQLIEDEQVHPGRTVVNENRFNMPFKNGFTGPKRMREDFLQTQHLKTTSITDNRPRTYQLMRPSRDMQAEYSEDGESADTGSSMD